MFRLALKNIWAHKTRLALSMVSVFLGVAFLAGTLVFTATIKNSFSDLFTSVFKKTDAVVQSSAEVQNSYGEHVALDVPRSALKDIEKVKGVKVAQGEIETQNLVVLDKNGKRMFPVQGPPVFGMNIPKTAQLTQWVLLDKDSKNLSTQDTVNFTLSDNEVLVDKATADSKNLTVGSTIKVVAPADVREFTIVGFVRFGTADGIGGASAFLFNEKQITEISNQHDTYRAITIGADKGVSQEEVSHNIQKVLDRKYPGALEVKTGKELIKQTQEDIEGFLNFFTVGLLFFAMISFVVALIIIVNSFAIIMVQRKREYALMRAIGASRGQILRSVLMESIIVGFIASSLGVLGGIGLAISIRAIMESRGIEFPAGPIIVPSSAIQSGLIVGTLATFISAFFPALIASFVSPMEALRETAFEKNRRLVLRVIVSIIFAVLAGGTIAYSFTQHGGARTKIIGLGIALLVVLVIVVLPLAVKPFTTILGSRVVGAIFIIFGGRWSFGVTGLIARRNNYRNPRRSARTALALMIGVALVVFITVFVSSAKATFKEYLDSTYAADIVVSDFSPVPTTVTQQRCNQISTTQGVKASTCVRNAMFQLELLSQHMSEKHPLSASMTALDTAEFSTLFKMKYEGDPNNLSDTGIAVTKDFVDRDGVELGSQIRIVGATGEKVLKVKAILEEGINGNSSNIVVDNKVFNGITPETNYVAAMIVVDDGANVNNVKGKIDEIFANTGTEVNDFKSSRDQQLDSLNGPLQFVYGLLIFSIIIAVIGILNTMSLSILERKRELGLLRAVGTTKSQVRGCVRLESMILAVLGTSVGMIFGAGSGFLLVRALKEEGFTSFSLAPQSMVVILFLSAFIGTMAGAWPAWRATKVDVLKAISVE